MSLCFKFDEKKVSIPNQGHCLCGVCMFPSYLGGFSLGTPVSSHIPKIFMLDEFACLHRPSVSECGSAGCPAVEGCYIHGLVSWATR